MAVVVIGGQGFIKHAQGFKKHAQGLKNGYEGMGAKGSSRVENPNLEGGSNSLDGPNFLVLNEPKPNLVMG